MNNNSEWLWYPPQFIIDLDQRTIISKEAQEQENACKKIQNRSKQAYKLVLK